jgi:hypothetical protein
MCLPVGVQGVSEIADLSLGQAKMTERSPVPSPATRRNVRARPSRPVLLAQPTSSSSRDTNSSRMGEVFDLL